ncbi:uncharacterized protein LOC125035916 [Penaeus chinensis]|uniref:uncharacterized protein LOC125035916 n=1 Tax=Penaeus chinensis TaxID=139456 RepID=UPI001FB6D808|nr:uncharacterized protein LOC125035916 [Penaeus chinensis]
MDLGAARGPRVRIGPWTEAEKNRLLIGLFSELDIKSLDDVLDMRAVPWNRILPYVRTRNYMNLKQRCHYMICKERQRCGESFSNENRVKLIDWIYESEYREVAEINWQDVAVQFPDNTLAVIKDWFFNVYYSIPTQYKRSFEDSIEYLHRTVKKRHASFERLSKAAVSGASNCLKNQQKEDDVESVSDMESTDIDEAPAWDDEIDSSVCRGEGEDIQKSNSDRHTSMNIKLNHQRVCKNRDSNNDHYLDENQGKLLNCIRKGDYKTLGNISWKEVTKQFPGTTVSSVSAYFYRLYCTIPKRIRRNLNEGLEYLQKNVHRNSADLSGPTVTGKTEFSEGMDNTHQIKVDFGQRDTDIDDPPAWDDEMNCSESSDEDDLQERNLE